MTVKFYKYQGTGNDFILIDNRTYGLKKNVGLIKKLCDRRFGIGADGLILLQKKKGYDFEMVYFNSDGNESTMCGNGGRCIVQFAHDLGLIKKTCTFLAIDGKHEGEILRNGNVSLKMKDANMYAEEFYAFGDTGSPHAVVFEKDVKNHPVVEEGRAVRNLKAFKSIGGANVNYVQVLKGNKIYVRTYERGVEDETLSCGTGVVAASMASALYTKKALAKWSIETPGGSLQVSFTKKGNRFTNVFLIGSAVKVFEGECSW